MGLVHPERFLWTSLPRELEERGIPRRLDLRYGGNDPHDDPGRSLVDTGRLSRHGDEAFLPKRWCLIDWPAGQPRKQPSQTANARWMEPTPSHSLCKISVSELRISGTNEST